MKKRVFAFLLVVLTVSSLAACSASESKVRSELVGKWGMVDKDGEKSTLVGWVFYSDGTCASLVVDSTAAEGTYVIESGKIVLTYDSGHTTYFEYKFENGELKLKGEDAQWWNMYKR